MVATPTLLLVQAPPAVPSDNVAVEPLQIIDVPEITVGVVFTLKVLVV